MLRIDNNYSADAQHRVVLRQLIVRARGGKVLLSAASIPPKYLVRT